MKHKIYIVTEINLVRFPLYGANGREKSNFIYIDKRKTLLNVTNEIR